MSEDNETTNADVQHRLKTFKEENFVSNRNAELVEDFIMELKANSQTGNYRRRWYISKFNVILKHYLNQEDFSTTELDKLSKNDVVRLIGMLEDDKADDTVNGYKSALRMFFRYRYPLKEDRPKELRKLNKTDALDHNTQPDRVVERYVFSPEQIWKLVEVAENSRDALLPIMGLDAGARTRELAEVQLSDIKMRSDCAEVTFHDCKNGKSDRELPLSHCIDQLRTWMENHPKSNDSDAYLWGRLRSYKDLEKGSQMSMKSLNKVLKKLCKMAKEEYPKMFEDMENPSDRTIYDLRHSSAQMRGQKFGVKTMMWWYGWTQPDMAEYYGEDDNKQLKNNVKRQQGLKVEDDSRDTIQKKECPRCEIERSPSATYCPQCSLPLDSETALKDQALLKAGKKVMEIKLDGKAEDQDVEKVVEEVIS